VIETSTFVAELGNRRARRVRGEIDEAGQPKGFNQGFHPGGSVERSASVSGYGPVRLPFMFCQDATAITPVPSAIRAA